MSRARTAFFSFLAISMGCRATGPAPRPIVAQTSSLERVAAADLCVTSGKVSARGAGVMNVDTGGMRAVVRGDASRVAEIAFTYRGPSGATRPLASGELRRQIGLKLRAHDTCNLVYVMWRVEPSPGVVVSIKSNPGRSSHAECGAGGYENLRSDVPRVAPSIVVGERHVLRAELVGRSLRVLADGEVAWEGRLPRAAFAVDGPAGVRSDNGNFDFELRVPGEPKHDAPCGWR
ncbi:MAG: hypothetical protein KF819_08680 [Labilithrix sp.]|nr:hypothetical protein [Labilithrix sp.]